MKIVMIGSGNVCAVLGRKFRAAGHEIVQIVARNARAASELAYEWNTVSTNYFSAVSKEAEIYLIAVSDDAIAEVAKEIKLPGKVVAHTAASVSMDVLKKVTTHYGVFYPLQSLRKEIIESPEVPVFFEGSDELAKRKLESLAHSIAFQKVAEANGEAILKLHVAAVIASNFTNHLYSLAEQYCRKEGLDFRQLIPLITETANRLKDISPRAAQTGPALRHDQETIQKHLSVLREHKHLKEIYELMTKSIQEDIG